MKVEVLECSRFCQEPALALIERDVGAPFGRQVLIEVEATSVNPIDVKRATGYGARLLSLKGAGRTPLVLGNDVAGVVKTSGPHSADYRIGQRVYGLLPTGRRGAHASAVLADARWLRPSPSGVSPEALAVLPYTFTTATLALRAAGLTRSNAAGARVLIHGAAGGLGRLAMQILVPWGARITAVCGTQNVQDCKALGAEQVLDRYCESLASLAPRYDATLNFASWVDDAALLALLKPDALGHATTVHPLLDNFDRLGWLGGLGETVREMTAQRRRLKESNPGARYRWVTFRPDRAALDDLHSMLLAGTVSLPLGIRTSMHDAVAAFAHVRDGRLGRAVLVPNTL